MKHAIGIAAVAAGLAVTASRSARADITPPVHDRVVGVSGDWMPTGTIVYSGNYGEGDFDVDQAFGGTAWLGWEVLPGFELGAQVRYIANEQISGDMATGSELITSARIAAHTRPSPDIDVAFVVAPGFSHVYIQPSINLPDASGFTVDFAGELSVPVSKDVFAVFTLGYQRGFQRTSEVYLGQDAVTAWATGYGHLGAGLSTRF
jgi:hypothetical protein